MNSPAPRYRVDPEPRLVQSGSADPLIKALIEKLPHAGHNWPAAERQAWLSMMDTAFVVVYGAAAAGASAPRSAPARTAATHSNKRTSAVKKTGATASKPGGAKPTPPAPNFYIDLQGHARNAAGETILPGDVNDVIYDKRGELGDLAAIIWADGSTGVPKGMRLDISTSV